MYMGESGDMLVSELTHGRLGSDILLQDSTVP